MVGGEITWICMDNSRWMTKDITWFINQVKAIGLYCERKLKAHPDNLVGIVRMGELDLCVQLRPTKNFQVVKGVLQRFFPTVRQNLNLLVTLELCEDYWFHYKDMDKRIVVFAGGPLKFRRKDMKAVVHLLKEGGTSVVIDVVDFFPVLDNAKAKSLKHLVTYMNEQNNDKNKKGIYLRVKPEEGSISDALSTSLILPPLVVESSRKRKQKKRPAAKLKIRTKKPKKHSLIAN